MVSICHCSDCQTLSGTAFRVAIFAPEEKFRLDARRTENLCEDGRKRQQARAGILRRMRNRLVYATSVGEGPKAYGIRVGTARQRDQLPPKRQIWHRSAVAWLLELEGLVTKEVNGG